MTGQIVQFNGKKYLVKKFIGKGKSAHSYIIINDFDRLVLKVIHDEPCDYYQFHDKYQSEISAYQQLVKIGVNVPELLGVDHENRWIIKDYIHGNTIAQLVAMGRMTDDHFAEIFKMAHTAQQAGVNLDYFPNNFVWGCKKLYYIDFEINPYNENWNLQNWGIYYWLNKEGMKIFLDTGDASSINANPEKGIPIKEPFEAEVKRLVQKFGIDA